MGVLTLAKGQLQRGYRVPDVQMVNHCGGASVWLHQVLPSTGHWHLLILAGNIGTNATDNSNLNDLCAHPDFQRLVAKREVLRTLSIHCSLRTTIEITDLPEVLRCTPEGPILDDDRVFTDVESYHHGHGRAYEKLFGDLEGQEQQRLELLRPDSHVAFTGEFKDALALSLLLDEWTNTTSIVSTSCSQS